MTILISSQRYSDDQLIAAKRAAKDYVVSVSPIFNLLDQDVQLILDGHHSFRAAKLDGVEPEICVATATDSDRIQLLVDGDVEGFLEATRIDADLYDISTGFDL